MTTVSFNPLFTQESINEIKKLLNSKEFYLTPDGDITFSVKTTTLDLVVKHMTEVPNELRQSK